MEESVKYGRARYFRENPTYQIRISPGDEISVRKAYAYLNKGKAILNLKCCFFLLRRNERAWQLQINLKFFFKCHFI